MKILKKIALVLLVLFVVIQFIRPKKNTNKEMTQQHIFNMYPSAENVKTLVGNACNDCHSNNTNYPWYAEVQPIAWWLNDHVQEGKKHFNISEFGAYSLRKQYHKLEEVVDEVKEKKMPLENYTWMHKNSKITDEQRTIIASWATTIMDSMKAKYPIDSLIKKKS